MGPEAAESAEPIFSSACGISAPLELLEEVLHESARGMEGFRKAYRQLEINAGLALAEIHARSLWRQSGMYDTFAAYCADRWGLKPDRVSRLIGFGHNADRLEIANVAQWRELAKLGADYAAQRRVTDRVRRTNGGELSARAIKREVEREQRASTRWPEDMRVEIGALRPHAERFTVGPVDALRENMREIGLVNPPVVQRDGTVLSGHRRLEAARELGWERLPVIRTDLEGLEALAFMLSEQRIAQHLDREWRADEAVREMDRETVRARLAPYVQQYGGEVVRGWIDEES